MYTYREEQFFLFFPLSSSPFCVIILVLSLCLCVYIKVWLKAERSGSTSLVGSSSSSKSASFAQPCVNRRTEVLGRERQVWLLDTAAEKLVDSSSIKREKHKIAINCMLVHSFCALRQTVSANRLMRSGLFLAVWLVKVLAGSSLYTTAQSGFTTLAFLPVEDTQTQTSLACTKTTAVARLPKNCSSNGQSIVLVAVVCAVRLCLSLIQRRVGGFE